MNSTTLEIRPETPLDCQAIAQVNLLAFGQENEARLVERIRASKQFVPELSLVADIGGAVVGHILFSYVDLVGEETWQVLALAPLAVQPAFQNQGIGSKLVAQGLEAADAISPPGIAPLTAQVLVVVLGYAHFYARFGFEPASRYGIEPSFAVPEEAYLVKPLRYRQHYRGKVVYPPAFDEV